MLMTMWLLSTLARADDPEPSPADISAALHSFSEAMQKLGEAMEGLDKAVEGIAKTTEAIDALAPSQKPRE